MIPIPLTVQINPIAIQMTLANLTRTGCSIQRG
jgi:hypothetical protein